MGSLSAFVNGQTEALKLEASLAQGLGTAGNDEALQGTVGDCWNLAFGYAPFISTVRHSRSFTLDVGLRFSVFHLLDFTLGSYHLLVR